MYLIVLIQSVLQTSEFLFWDQIYIFSINKIVDEDLYCLQDSVFLHFIWIYNFFFLQLNTLSQLIRHQKKTICIDLSMYAFERYVIKYWWVIIDNFLRTSSLIHYLKLRLLFTVSSFIALFNVKELFCLLITTSAMTSDSIEVFIKTAVRDDRWSCDWIEIDDM